MKSNRLILVTGGSGYIGSAMVPLLAQRYPVRVYESMAFGNPIAGTPNVEFVQGDIRDTGKVETVLRGVTDVVHLAGIVTDELVDLNPVMARQVNNDAMRWLCVLALQEGVQRFVYASSSSVYGTQPEVCTEHSLVFPMTDYARTKLEGERILDEFTQRKLDVTPLGELPCYINGGLVTTSVRCATACGPAPRMRLDTIVNIFCKQAFFDGEITVHGGDQWRTNINVLDVAALYVFLLDAPASVICGQVYNATAGNHTALQLAEMVQAIAGGRITINRNRMDPRHYRMDGAKLWRNLGWRPSRTIEDAISANLTFFENGGVINPDDDIWYNTRRMREAMQGVP